MLFIEKEKVWYEKSTLLEKNISQQDKVHEIFESKIAQVTPKTYWLYLGYPDNFKLNKDLKKKKQNWIKCHLVVEIKARVWNIISALNNL